MSVMVYAHPIPLRGPVQLYFQMYLRYPEAFACLCNILKTTRVLEGQTWIIRQRPPSSLKTK